MKLPAAIDACAVALHSQKDPETGRIWIHLLPAGTFTGRDGRGPYRAEDAQAIMATSRALAGRTRMPVDYNHAIDLAAPQGGASPAAGWITGLQAHTDGIWGLVEWTARAARHIAEREYRYISPAFTHTQDGRVTAILRASLVNVPNLTQLVALASMEKTVADPSESVQDPRQILDAIRALLGLSQDTDAVAILGAITALRDGATATHALDPSKFVPIGEFLRVTQELNRVHQGIEAHAAKLHVEEQVRSGRLLPFMKDWGISLCTVNKAAFDDFIAKAGGITQSLVGPLGMPPAAPPSRHGHANGLSDTEAHIASVLGHTPEEFSKVGQQ